MTGASVIIADWRGRPTAYRLFPATGAYESCPNKDLSYGFGQPVRIDRMPSFAAIYAHENRLWLQLGDRRFDLCDDRRVVVENRTFSRRQLQVFHRGDCEFSVTYSSIFAELREWPMPGHIFNYAAEITRADEGIQRALTRWTASRQQMHIR